MAIVKGYYNLNNGVFLGPVTAPSDMGGGPAYTPRYIDGVCFGEFDTETEHFRPLTNPYTTNGGIMTVDEDQDAFKAGGHKQNVTGIYEDKGADVASKQFVQGTALGRGKTPSVVTRDETGQQFDGQELRKMRDHFRENYNPHPDIETSEEPEEEVETNTDDGRFLTKGELPVIDFDNLF